MHQMISVFKPVKAHAKGKFQHYIILRRRCLTCHTGGLPLKWQGTDVIHMSWTDITPIQRLMQVSQSWGVTNSLDVILEPRHSCLKRRIPLF